ncbi:MAG: phosphate signaling complex protein PhoU [Alphaproteobacteria bacterium]
MASTHIVKAYDEELQRLNNTIARMGGLAEEQLASAIQSAVKRDSELASETIENDDKVDRLEYELDDFVVRLLALRQPMASDLRNIIAALKIASDLERIADCATNVAERAIALNELPPVKPLYTIPRMGGLVQQMIKDVLDAYIERDADKAVEVWHRDDEVDEMYTALLRELLTYMLENPRNITPCTHLLFIAKNIERIGDHATNIAEMVHFLVHGGRFQEARPQDDPAGVAAVTPGPGKKGKAGGK